ncbi:MAG TPA: thiol:disulfide interchange protein DsbA/DsbL [Pseudomonadales bacterium]|nr:thiol:disulfide interchange protein DsbA/DsbL [Pseudomonadales bacterium]
MKKLFAMLMFTALLPLLGFADEAAAPAATEKYVAGTHYQVIPAPVRTANPDKIEVNEVFWYGCPHCLHFEPALEPWVKSLPSDVDFERTPAIWRPNMEAHSRIYYAAKQLGVLESMHPIIFKAMQEEKQDLETEDQAAKLFAAHGVDEAAFRKAYNSFSVQSLTKQGDARVRSYGVTGTPQLVINGKYLVGAGRKDESNPNSVNITQADMLEIASFLIEKERKAMAGTKK